MIVINEDSTVVTAAIPNGARIIAGPLIAIPNIGASSWRRSPLSISVPTPKVRTRNGMAILVRIGQSIALTRPRNSTRSSMSPEWLTSTPNPKKLIRYIPMMFPINTIKLLFKLFLGVCFSLIISIVNHYP